MEIQRFTANFPRVQIDAGRLKQPFPFELSHRDWLISISDAAGWPIQVRDPFAKVFEFFFDDESDPNWPGIMQQSQAVEMANIIRQAKDQDKNLWVHCTAGMCRSGAVVEILGLLGWTIVEGFSPARLPNTHVFKMLRLQFDELKNSWELDDQMGEKWQFYKNWIDSIPEDEPK